MVRLLDVRKVHSRYRRTANDSEDEKCHQESDQNHAAVEDQPQAAPAFALGIEKNWLRTGHCAGQIYRSCEQKSGQPDGIAAGDFLVSCNVETLSPEKRLGGWFANSVR